MDSIVQRLKHYLEIYDTFDCRLGIYLPVNITQFDLSWINDFIDEGIVIVSEANMEELYPEYSNLIPSWDHTWMDVLDVLIPIHAQSYNAQLIEELRNKLIYFDKSVTINDQISCEYQIHEGSKPLFSYFRGMQLIIHPGTVLPFYYVNDPFINFIIEDVSPQSKTLLDLCSGSGCIGLSLTREITSINRTDLIDLSPYAIQSEIANIKLHSPAPNVSIKAIQSQGFNEVDTSQQYDIIVANPPHRNNTVNRVQDYGGADTDWGFHKDFFNNLTTHLNDKGTAYLLENGREGFVPKEKFKELFNKHSNHNLCYELTNISGSEFYIAKLNKYSPA